MCSRPSQRPAGGELASSATFASSECSFRHTNQGIDWMKITSRIKTKLNRCAQAPRGGFCSIVVVASLSAAAPTEPAGVSLRSRLSLRGGHGTRRQVISCSIVTGPLSRHIARVNIVCAYNNHSESTRQGKAKTMSIRADARCRRKATQWQLPSALRWTFCSPGRRSQFLTASGRRCSRAGPLLTPQLRQNP